jgi:hypothetical protein
MRISSIASLCTVAIAALLLAPNNGGATSTMSAPNVSKSAGTLSLLEQASCKLVDGHLKCTKKKKHESKNDDDDHKGKDKDKETTDKDEKETKTVKLIKLQDTCSVHTPGMGGSGCATPLIHRCDKLKDGDEVCCCYKVDDSQPPAQ